MQNNPFIAAVLIEKAFKRVEARSPELSISAEILKAKTVELSRAAAGTPINELVFKVLLDDRALAKTCGVSIREWGNAKDKAAAKVEVSELMKLASAKELPAVLLYSNAGKIYLYTFETKPNLIQEILGVIIENGKAKNSATPGSL